MSAERLRLLHLLIPFSLPSAADARIALADFTHPAFARLVARATLVETATGDAFQRTLPHERWIARQFGIVPATGVQQATRGTSDHVSDHAPDAGNAANRTLAGPSGAGRPLRNTHSLPLAGRAPGSAAAGRPFRDPHNLPDNAPDSAPDSAVPATADIPSDDAPLAPYMLLADGGTPGNARWACVQPVHVQVALDHLLLIDPASLALADADAATLYAVARPLIEALGVRVQAPTPHRWYLSGDALGALAGASPLRASGRSIEIWLPHETRTGQRSRLWMKLQNEVQMAWFEHPLNEAREARGLPAVNSVWLHAQGALRPARSPYTHVLSDAVATRGLALAAGDAGDVTAGDRAADAVTTRAAGTVSAGDPVTARAADSVAADAAGSGAVDVDAADSAVIDAADSVAVRATDSGAVGAADSATAHAADRLAVARAAAPVAARDTASAAVRTAAPKGAMAARAAHAAPRPVCLPAPANFSALFCAFPCTALGNAARGSTALVELDPFASSFLEQDWPRWRAAFAALERDWFAPALAALQAGEIRALGLTLCGDTGSVTLRITRGDLRKFWRRRTFASLCVE